MITKSQKANSVKSAAINFPVVTRSKDGQIVTIIYADHSEVFELKSTRTKADGEREGCLYDPYSELEMDLGNGATIVHCSKETRYYPMPADFVASVKASNEAHAKITGEM